METSKFSLGMTIPSLLSTRAHKKTTAQGATADWDMLTANQAAGHLLIIPPMVVYIEYNLGEQLSSLHNVWRPYFANGTELEVNGR